MKSKKGIQTILSCVILPVLALAVLLCFLSAVSNLTSGRQSEDMHKLEEALRRAAVACYAAEGIYPPDLGYLQQHYGLQIDEKRYVVDYVPIADNLMPDITILEK